MMKKLFVLMLVLGLATAANAALSIVAPATMAPGATVTVAVVDDTGNAYTAYIGGIDSTGMSATVNAGPDAAIQQSPAGYAGYYKIQALDFSPPSDILPGTHFIGSLTSGAGDLDGTVYSITMYDQQWSGVLDSADVTVRIPEPITIGLLGLGGLFLRRRK
jgi:hypothetical protein